MEEYDLKSQLKRIRNYVWAVGVFWTVVIAGSLTWNIQHQSKETLALAESQARIALKKDVLYRRWNAEHGGVYVPVTKVTPPNPYLDVAERDVTTTSGLHLTLVNPAYMTRQVHEIGQRLYGLHGHMTSLNPIRPANAPDPWETQSLLAFERGETEVSSIEDLDGEANLRLMRPLVTKKSCLRCHAAQGYELGDIRGGLSETIPMAPLLAIGQTDRVAVPLTHAFLWLLGLWGLHASTRQIARRVRQRAALETQRLTLLQTKRERNDLRDAVGAMEGVLGVVSHELRTPLAGMRAMAEFLLQDGARETAEFDTFLHGIHDEVVKMSATVNDTLEVARMSSGRAHWDWGRVCVGTVCEEAMATVRSLVDASKVSLNLRVIPEDLTMMGDSGAIRRLLVNLLSNANRYTASGSIEVQAAAVDKDDAAWVEFRVWDTGRGIAPKIAKQLGVAFALNSGVVGERHVPGSGLGLSICRGIVAAHGGRIHVDTELQHGTRVVALLRRDLAEPASIEGAAEIVCEVTR